MKKIILRNKEQEENIVSVNNRVEDKSKRTRYAKHYKNNDGTYTMELSATPIHFYNETNAQYEDIDNTLILNNKGKLKLKSNAIDIEFAEEIQQGNELFTFKNNNHTVSLNYLGKISKDKKRVINYCKARIDNNKKFSNHLVYPEIAPSIDLEYIIDSNHIKENIIIKEKQDSYEFEFKINIGNLVARLSEDEKEIELFDENNNKQFLIPAPFMFDANNIQSDKVYYEIIQDNNILSLTVKADTDWINELERVFPVKIDPQIVAITISNNEALECFNITSGYVANPTTNRGNVGRVNGQWYSDHFKFVFNIVLGKLQKLEIKKAEVKLTGITIADNLNIDITVNKTYAQQGPFSESVSSKIVTINKSSISNSSFTLDLTTLVNSWKAKNNTKGTILFADTLINIPSGDTIMTFNLPTLIITYLKEIDSPQYYLNMKQPILIESAKKFDIGLSSSDGNDTGLLITYLDEINNKVFQQYFFSNHVYVRNSININTWNEWCNSSYKITSADTTLNIED